MGDQITHKFLRPLLQADIQLPPELELKPQSDPLSIEALIDQVKARDDEQPAEEPAEEPAQYSVIDEVESILSSEKPADLEQQIEATKHSLLKAYKAACDKEDWYAALAIQQWFMKLGCIYVEEPKEKLTSNLEEWLSKAKKPDELYVCY